MFSTSPCRAIYRLDLSTHHASNPRLLITTIHLAPYSTKPTKIPARNKASAAISYTSKSSTSSPPRKATPESLPAAPERALRAIPIDRLNPPRSTRPPPLILPTRQPRQPAYKYYYTLGRTYLTFYKTGLKNLYANFHLTRPILDRIASQTPSQALTSSTITRAEWLTLLRYRADIARLPLFGLVFIICGEFTPLVVLTLSGAVPRSLWIPKQVEKARRKVEARRRESFRNPDPGLGLEAMRKEVVLHIGRSLGLYSSIWDRIGMPPMPLVRRRVKQRMEFVEMDDEAIEREAGVEKLEGEELVMAAEVRGIDVLGREETELRRLLGEWMKARKLLEEEGKAVTWLYLRRPAAWPKQD